MNRMGSTVNRVVPFLPGRSKPKTMVCCRCMWNLALKRLAESFILYSFPTWHDDTVVSRTQKDPKNPQTLTILDIPVLCLNLEEMAFRDSDCSCFAASNSRRSSGRHASAGSGRPKYSWKVTSWIRQPGPFSAVGVVNKTWLTWYWSLVFLEGVETFQTLNLSNLSFCYKMLWWFAFPTFPKSPGLHLSFGASYLSRKNNPPNMESPENPQQKIAKVAWCDDCRQVTQLTLHLVAHASPASQFFPNFFQLGISKLPKWLEKVWIPGAQPLMSQGPSTEPSQVVDSDTSKLAMFLAAGLPILKSQHTPKPDMKRYIYIYYYVKCIYSIYAACW